MRFIEGLVKFVDAHGEAKGSSTFPSAIVILRPPENTTKSDDGKIGKEQSTAKVEGNDKEANISMPK